MNKVKIPDKNDMSKVDLIIHILTSLPEEYKVSVSTLEDCLMNTTTAVQLGINMVCKKITLCHNRIKHQKQNKSDEHALDAYQKQFKGRLSKCGKYGHKSGDSRCNESQSQGQDRKFSTF